MMASFDIRSSFPDGQRANARGVTLARPDQPAAYSSAGAVAATVSDGGKCPRWPHSNFSSAQHLCLATSVPRFVEGVSVKQPIRLVLQQWSTDDVGNSGKSVGSHEYGSIG